MNTFVGHVDVTAAALYHQTSFVTLLKFKTMVYLSLVTGEAVSLTVSSLGTVTLQEIRKKGRILGT